jgi:hypothetical protein
VFEKGRQNGGVLPFVAQDTSDTKTCTLAHTRGSPAQVLQLLLEFERIIVRSGEGICLINDQDEVVAWMWLCILSVSSLKWIVSMEKVQRLYV